MKKVKAGVFLVVGIAIYVIVFNSVNTEALFSIFRGKVTNAELNADAAINYIGYKAGDDIQRLTSSKDLPSENTYITIDANEGYPLGLYKIKNKQDMEDLKYTRNSKGRKVYDANKKIYEYVEDPGSYKGFYNSYYLVALQDGTYIVAYLDDIYGKKIEKGKAITLPVGCIEKMSGTVLNKVQDIKDKNINTTVILNCFNEEDFKQNETKYLVIRGAIAFITIAILYAIVCRIFPKVKLWKE